MATIMQISIPIIVPDTTTFLAIMIHMVLTTLIGIYHLAIMLKKQLIIPTKMILILPLNL